MLLKVKTTNAAAEDAAFLNCPEEIMKLTILMLSLFVLTFVGGANGQNSVKLFDPVEVGNSYWPVPWSYSSAVPFDSKQLYLSCPRNAEAILSGPDGDKLIVDNFISMNGNNVCPMGRCFRGVFATPVAGMPADGAYNGVDPIDVSDLLTGSGIYRFELKDHGWTYGSTEIYLHTTCSLEEVSQLCHRNFGSKGGRNLSVAASAVPAHLAHGDTQGPCSDQN